jgi:hypothetical protein
MVKEILEAAPKAIAVLSFIILALTVVHEEGYFWVIGGHFLTIASAYDYLANSILWLPPVVLGFVFALATNLLYEAFRRKRGPQESYFFGANRRARRRRILIVLLFSFYGVAAVVLGYFFMPPYILILYGASISTAFIVGVISIFEYFRSHVVVTLSIWSRISIMAIPALMIIVFFVGAQEASFDVQGITNVYFLRLKAIPESAQSAVDPQKIQVLRSFDKGVLFRDPVKERIGFVRWDAVQSLERNSYREDQLSRGCQRFPKLCNKTHVEP